YKSGRVSYQANYGETRRTVNICCAWFDENTVAQSDHNALQTFKEAHKVFVNKRIQFLQTLPPICRAKILPIEKAERKKEKAIQTLSQAIYHGIHELHEAHAKLHPDGDKKVSIGLVRMANIQPLVAVVKDFTSHTPLSESRLHLCVYHSRYPLILRSEIERSLDNILNRSDPQAIWGLPEIKQVLDKHTEQNQIFVIFSTSVAEVGRDHDYDWVIAEPSSMRSIIQVAGRIQRHRRQECIQPNLYILNQNYKALMGEEVVFQRPGFETKEWKLKDKKIENILRPEQYEVINSIPRIKERESLEPNANFVDLEHASLRRGLFQAQGSINDRCASFWWQNSATWCHELQRRTRFRESFEQEEFLFFAEDEDDELIIHKVADDGKLIPMQNLFNIETTLSTAPGIQFWFDFKLKEVLLDIKEDTCEREGRDITMAEICRKFANFEIEKDRDNVLPWNYSPQLGVYRKL
ncbi:MAG: type I-F CRISPR-associated helicase Cas3, partial [Pseudobdellovibrionaceae bacterium]